MNATTDSFEIGGKEGARRSKRTGWLDDTPINTVLYKWGYCSKSLLVTNKQRTTVIITNLCIITCSLPNISYSRIKQKINLKGFMSLLFTNKASHGYCHLKWESYVTSWDYRKAIQQRWRTSVTGNCWLGHLHINCCIEVDTDIPYCHLNCATYEKDELQL